MAYTILYRHVEHAHMYTVYVSIKYNIHNIFFILACTKLYICGVYTHTFSICHRHQIQHLQFYIDM